MINNKKIQAVIFDMDGVIFDSEKLVLAAWQKVAKKHHMPQVEKVYYQCVGVTQTVTVEKFKSFYGTEFPYELFAQEVSKEFWAGTKDGKLPVKHGVVELLEYLRKQGFCIGVASSTRKKAVVTELKAVGLDCYFQDLTGGDTLSRSKPEPDIFLLAAENLGVNPENCIVIEDSFHGIKAAKRAGMYPIMVPDMIEPDKEMRELTGQIFKSLSEVKQWMEQIESCAKNVADLKK